MRKDKTANQSVVISGSDTSSAKPQVGWKEDEATVMKALPLVKTKQMLCLCRKKEKEKKESHLRVWVSVFISHHGTDRLFPVWPLSRMDVSQLRQNIVVVQVTSRPQSPRKHRRTELGQMLNVLSVLLGCPILDTSKILLQTNSKPKLQNVQFQKLNIFFSNILKS